MLKEVLFYTLISLYTNPGCDPICYQYSLYNTLEILVHVNMIASQSLHQIVTFMC